MNAPPNLMIMTTAKFSMLIENVVKEKSISYMDAIVDHCDKNGLEIEVMAKLINKVIKEKIEAEAIGLHYLPKVGKLPL